MKFCVLVLFSHLADHFKPRRMQFTTSQYLVSFQDYKDLKIPSQRDIEKGLETMDSAEPHCCLDNKSFVMMKCLFCWTIHTQSFNQM